MEEKKKYSKLKKSPLCLFLVFLVSIFIWMLIVVLYPFLFVCVIPEDLAAYGDIYVLAEAINTHYKETGKVVDDLSELPDKYNTHITDPWGNPIAFRKEGDGDIFLVSFGSDGKKGGKGKKADIILYYNPEDIKSFRMGSISIPESTNTRSKIRYLKKEIINYYQAKKGLPQSLKDLVLEHEFFTNDDKDYWGNRIIFKITEDGLVLVSCGPELDEDIENITFETAIVDIFTLSGSPEKEDIDREHGQ